MRDALPSYLRPFVTFAYKTGWRDAEIADLTWNRVDLKNGIVRLEAGETKNDEGRTVFLDNELTELFHSQKKIQRRHRTQSEYVFPNESGTGRLKDFRGAWNKACRDAGLGYGYKTNKKYVAKRKDKLPPGPNPT